jgi:hypothetical protein
LQFFKGDVLSTSDLTKSIVYANKTQNLDQIDDMGDELHIPNISNNEQTEFAQTEEQNEEFYRRLLDTGPNSQSFSLAKDLNNNENNMNNERTNIAQNSQYFESIRKF